MGEEIERKFLLRENGKDSSTPQLLTVCRSLEDLELDIFGHGNKIKQGYLGLEDGARLAEYLVMTYNFTPDEARLRDEEGQFYFTLKADGSVARGHEEAIIDERIFSLWWDLTLGRRLEKFRLAKPYQGRTLQLDVYSDRDLIIAEIEVPSIGAAYSLIPLGRDVTEDSRYKNKNLGR